MDASGLPPRQESKAGSGRQPSYALAWPGRGRVAPSSDCGLLSLNLDRAASLGPWAVANGYSTLCIQNHADLSYAGRRSVPSSSSSLSSSLSLCACRLHRQTRSTGCQTSVGQLHRRCLPARAECRRRLGLSPPPTFTTNPPRPLRHRLAGQLAHSDEEIDSTPHHTRATTASARPSR